MSAEKYVGRIGGLAVALGIGIAVAASPGVACADDLGSASSGGAGTDGPAASKSTGGATGTSTGTNPRKRGASARGTAAGGAVHSIQRTSPAAEAPGAGSGSDSKRRLRDEPRRTPRLKVSAVPEPGDLADPAPSRSEPAAPLRAVDVAPDPPAAPQVATAVIVRPDEPAPAHVVTHAIPAAPPQVGDVALGLPTAPNADPSAADGPLAPAYSPLELALAAWGTRPREEDPSQPAGLTPTSESLTASAAPNASPPPLGAVGSIPVGANPSGVVASPDGRIYVANTGSNSVSVLTAIGERIDANPSWFSKDISVGWTPGALALNADGTRLYVANAGSGTVSVIDTFTYRRIDANPSWFSRDIKVGSTPSGLAFASDGARLYVANTGGNTVSVIDTATNGVTDTLAVGSQPSALALDPAGRLYVANRGGNTVSVIDTADHSVTGTLAVGSRPSALALGAGKLYVVNAGSNTVSVIDTATNTVGANPISVGPAPSSVALSADGGYAYVANGNDSVSVIDTTTSAVIDTVAFDSDATGGHAVAVTAGGTLYVTDARDRAVRVLAPPSAVAIRVTEIGNVAVSGYPVGAVLSADGSRALVVTGPSPLRFTGTTRLAVVNTATGAQVGTTITLTGKPSAPVLSADGRRAAVTVTDAGTTHVAVVDLATGTQVTTPLPDPPAPGAGRSRSVTTTVDGGSIHVAVIDTATGAQVGDTVTLTGDWGLTAYSRDGSRAVVTAIDAGSTQVAAIDLNTGTRPGVIFTRTGTWDIPLIGGDYGRQLLNADGSRALLSSVVTDPVTGAKSTRIAVVNTLTGAQTGATLTLPGEQFGSRLVSLDGSRALMVTNVYDGRTSINTTRLVVIDTTTGTQIGATAATTGFLNGGVLFSADTGRAVVTTISSNFNTTGVATTEVAVIDTGTGNQVGGTLTLSPDNGLTVLSANGLRALVNTSNQSVVLNTATGTPAGTLAGARAFPLLSPDGSRAVTTTMSCNWFTGAYTTRLSVAQIV